MKHTVSLKERYEFQRLYRSGRSYVTPYCAVYLRKTKRGYNRLGITASKKIGNAVQRNRARRLLREGYRLLEERFPPGLDLVIVARTRAVEAKLQPVKAALEQILAKLPDFSRGDKK